MKWFIDEEDILYIIALTAARGADAALTEAIEREYISSDQHIDSADYADAVREVEAF